jgi:hypothetical protein
MMPSPYHDVVPANVAGLSFIPTPWVPADGEVFEGRLRCDPERWHRMVWLGWSKANPSQALVQLLDHGPRAFDTILEMRKP